MMTSIRPQNEKAAKLWGSSGRAYDSISNGVAAGIHHGVVRLAPERGERILDVATGTGWTARELARRGARVTGVDIAEGMLSAGREITSEQGLDIAFERGDAEALPFEDETFDAAISTFGIMFTADPRTAAAELARVLKPGGRAVVVAWTPESNAAAMRELMTPYAPPPPDPAPPPPWAWGTAEGADDYLGADFDLAYETDTLHLRHPSKEAAWEAYSEGFGPVKMVADSLDPEKRRELAESFTEWCGRFRTGLGVAIPCDYMVIAGRRK